MTSSLPTSAVTAGDDIPPPPRHVAIIMDGNGRWATRRNLPRSAGHRRGAQAAKASVFAALEFGIEYLTIYSFSSENWQRPTDEVSDLMGLLRYTMQREAGEMEGRGVRLRVIGDRQRLPADVQKAVENIEANTQQNTTLTVVIALSYGGRDEIVHAAKALAASAVRGELDAGEIDAAAVAEHLYTSGIPDPDLLIRTGGEQRISNFLLWQMAYTELVFLDTLWPDFDQQAFAGAIAEFQSRDRRYGGRNIG